MSFHFMTILKIYDGENNFFYSKEKGQMYFAESGKPFFIHTV